MKKTAYTSLGAPAKKLVRFSTDIPGLDRVLGGGLVLGSTVLLAGSPAAGKTILWLMAAGGLATKKSKVVFVSTEEDTKNVVVTAFRIGVLNPYVQVYGVDADFEEIIADVGVKVLIVDALQGSGSKRVASMNKLYRLSKTRGIAVVVISHINSDGEVRGGVSMEHACDTFLTLFPCTKEQEYCALDETNFRRLSVSKNRLGASGVSAMFEMTNRGLVEVQPEPPKKKRRALAV